MPVVSSELETLVKNFEKIDQFLTREVGDYEITLPLNSLTFTGQCYNAVFVLELLINMTFYSLSFRISQSVRGRLCAMRFWESWTTSKKSLERDI